MSRWHLILAVAVAVAVAVATILTVLLPPDKQKYHTLFLSLSSNTSASSHLHRLTLRPHPSSSPADSSAADYVASVLSSVSSVPARSVPYSVLLSFPLSRSLSLVGPTATAVTTFDLIEEPYAEDPYADVASEVLPTFHAYAFSGSAAGPAVYANYGRVEDFERLIQLGVKVNGCVAVARYGQIFRGDIVRNAEDAGAVAAILYTDSKDYGGPKLFPEGRGMPRSGVQRGSVFRGVGDPTTPGWASPRPWEEGERIGAEEVEGSGLMPRIPSLPVSARDGEEILKAVGGQVADADWQGGGDGGLVYRLGPGPGVVQINYRGNDTLAMIRNVVAVIEGELEPDRYWFIIRSSNI